MAELHIFLGAFAVYPWLAAIGLLGILITAALFLRMLRQVFFGALPPERPASPTSRRAEVAVLAVLLALVVLIGVWPGWLLELIDAGTPDPVAGARADMPVGDLAPEIAVLLTAVAVLLAAMVLPQRRHGWCAGWRWPASPWRRAVAAAQLGAQRLTFSGTFALDARDRLGAAD